MAQSEHREPEARLSEIIAPSFQEVHRDIITRGHREYWLMGGRGSGKSSFAAFEILLGMLKNRDASAIIYRKVAATLKESVMAQMLWAADRLGLREYFTLKLSPPELKCEATGQRILFRGADDVTKSKSLKLPEGYFGYLWFEELSEFSGMEDVRTIKASVLRGGGEAQTFYTYNPPVQASAWVNREALSPREDRLVHRSDYRDVPPSWLGDAFLTEAEALRRSDERAWRHMYLGEVTGLGGTVFTNLTVRPIPAEERETFGATFAGLDFGWYPDPTHFVRCAYDPARRRLWLFDEFRAVRLSNEGLFAALTEKGVTRHEEILCDAADPKSIADLRHFGLRCTAASKGPGSVRTSMRWLQSLREIVIDPVTCPAAAQEFSACEYERTRDGAFCESWPDRDNHAIDAVRYAMNRVWMRAGM